MSASPEAFAAASNGLASLGSGIRAANAAAAGSTTQVAVAAQDEVSAATAALFGSCAQRYQTLAGQAATFHDTFTDALLSSANSYAGAEAVNASSLTLADMQQLYAELINQMNVATRDPMIEQRLAVQQFTQMQEEAKLTEQSAMLLANQEIASAATDVVAAGISIRADANLVKGAVSQIGQDISKFEQAPLRNKFPLP